MSAPSGLRSTPWYTRILRDFGWRLYLIPVIALITVWLLIDVFASPAGEDPGADGGAAEVVGEEERVASPNPADSPARYLPPTELPPGGPYAEQGDLTYRVVGTPGLAVGEGTERTVRYVVEVENGVDTSGSGGDDALAAMVDATLANPKGWSHDPRFRLEHVGPEDNPDMRIQLTSVGTTHELCGAALAMETSCYTTMGNRVVLNESRWVRGAAPFAGDLGSYRQYLINHEVGHGLGYMSHEPCGAEGELAPIMMQQTLSLNNSELHAVNPAEVYPDDDATCVFNPWPYPRPVTE